MRGNESRTAEGRTGILLDDLIPLIVEHMAAAEPPNAVAHLALVSSSWLKPTQRVLYRYPILHTYHACYLLSRTLGGHPQLSSLVRAVELSPVSRPCESGRDCACRNVNAMALSLAPIFRLEGLREIMLGGDCAIRAEYYIRGFAKLEHVEKLRVEGMQWYWSFEVNRPVMASLRWTEGLAARLPNLKNLELINLDLNVAVLRAFKPSPPHLESLIMDRVRITSGPLSHLAKDSWHKLKHLTITLTEFSDDYDLRTILLDACSSLESMRYFIKNGENRARPRPDVYASALSQCTQLRDLQLSVPFDTPTMLLFGQHLKNLVVLKVYSNYDVQTEDWATGISDGLFPRLKEIQLPIGHELRRLADWQWSSLKAGTIRVACAKRNIELQFGCLPS